MTDIEAEIDRPGPDGFIYPQYGGYCFSNIPSLISRLLGLSTASPLSEISARAGLSGGFSRKVIAFLVDGFGYRQWLRYADRYEFLKRFTANGAVAPITAVFPSTTAASITAIHSGLTPQEHGLLEWWVYFRELGRVIVTLPFMELGGKAQDELLQSGVDAKILFDRQTIYPSLTGSGIRSVNLMHSSISNSAYSSRVLAGSEVVPFQDIHDLMERLVSLVSDVSSRVYIHVYWGAIDAAAHDRGLHSPEYMAELDKFFSSVAVEFLDAVPSEAARDVAILVFVDHGHVAVEPDKTLYLNNYPELVNCLGAGRNGDRIPPWGSARDVFLSLQAEKADTALKILNDALGDEATVLRSADALKSGLFGSGRIHNEFESRIGDILVLPRGNRTLGYELPFRKKFTMLGMHGGLSPDEMLIPLAIANLRNLT